MLGSLVYGVIVGVIIYVLVALVLWLIYGTWNVYASLPLVAAVAVGLTVAIANSAGKSIMKDYQTLPDNQLASRYGQDAVRLRQRLPQPSARLYNQNDEYVEDQ